MPNGFLDEIRSLLAEEETPQRVTNRILFGALQEIYQRMSLHDQQREELIDKVDALANKFNQMEWRIEKLEERQAASPSIVWLLQNRPRQTITWIIITVIILILLLALSEPLRMLLANLAGSLF